MLNGSEHENMAVCCPFRFPVVKADWEIKHQKHIKTFYCGELLTQCGLWLKTSAVDQ